MSQRGCPPRRPRRRCDNRPQPRPPLPEDAPLDIIFLVERLESLIANGKKLPLTSSVVVDQEAALALIDELRVAVPEEVRAAKRINAEGERIIDRANAEGERIIARAQEQAAFLISEEGLTSQAEAEGRQIVGAAREDAAETRRGADDYAASVLHRLEADVARTLDSIRRGIALLDRSGQAPSDGRAPAVGEGGDEDPEDLRSIAPARR